LSSLSLYFSLPPSHLHSFPTRRSSDLCFSDKSFAEACYLLDELEYDKIEIWFDENSEHLKPSIVVKDPDGFYNRYRELTRLTPIDRKSTRLNSSHSQISYAVFCLKKKK